MKTNSYKFYSDIFCLLVFILVQLNNTSFAQSIGDYRSNVAPTGLWNTAASWQTWDGTTWITAVSPPNSSSGAITILSGDSIRINSATSFDQLTIDNGGILAIFNTGTPTVFTLDDGAGAFDMEVNGKLYISVNATFTGTGSMRNNTNGIIILRNLGILQVNTTSNGTFNVSGTGNIQNTTLTNNGTFNLVDFTLNLNNANLINNGMFNFMSTANTWVAVTSGTGSFTNSASGIIHKNSASGIAEFSTSITFNNSGIIRGSGEYNFLSSTITNTGIISPGNSSVVQLTVNPLIISGKSPTFNMEINSTGGVAGTNYDQIRLTISGGNPNANFTGARLNVTDNAADPIGTTYTLFTSSSGSITGPFAQIILSPTLGNITYNSNSITVQKTSLGKHWVGSYLYQSNFSTTAELNEWTLVENNTATGSWNLTGSGSAILKMDNSAGGYAVRLFHQNGATPIRLPLDKINGVVEFHVLALTGGNQRFFLQAQEFDASGTYLSEQNIMTPRNTAGYVTINLSSITWNPLTTQIRFMIAGDNLSAQQGTIEFNYFKYTNTTQNWNNPANWSALPGGTGGAGVPTSSDVVFFDNVRTANCIVDQSVTISALNISAGYTGMISQGNNSFTVNTTATFSGGTFEGGSGAITIGGIFTLSGASFISTSGVLELRNNFEFTSGLFTHNNGTVKYNTINNTNQQISGTSTSYYNLEFTGLARPYNIISSGNTIVINQLTTSGSSFLTLNSGIIEVRGDININNSAAGGGGTTTLLINGTVAQNVNSSVAQTQGSLPKVHINKSSGTLFIKNTITVGNDWTYSSGMVDATTFSSTVAFGGNNLSINAAGMNFKDVVVFSNIVSLSNDINISGNLIISGTGILSGLNRTIHLEGNWTNYSTTGFTEGNSTLNIKGSSPQTISCAGGENLYHITVAAGSTFDMSAGGSLYIAGNWTNNGTFLPGAGTIIFNGTSIQQIGGSNSTSFYNMNISNTSGVSLASNTNLISTLTLSSNAKFTTTGFEYILRSDATGTARIAAIPANAVFTGNIRMQRYLPTRARFWYHIASPVTNSTVAMWQSGAPSEGFYVTGPFSGTSNPGNGINPTGVSAYSWNASTGLWNQFPEISNTDIIIPKTGYRVFIRDGNAAYNGGITSSKVFSVSGPPVTGNQTFNLLYFENGGSPAGGWNMIGNPYPSDINGDLSNSGWTTKTNMDGFATYIWDSDDQHYVSCNGGIGECIVPSSQAFWVKVHPGGGTLVATENVKVSGSHSFYKNSSTTANYIPVVLKNINDASKDITYLRFEEDATEHFDPQYDAYKLNMPGAGITSAGVLLCSMMDSIPLSINAKAIPEIHDTIPLKITAYPGNYLLDFSKRENLDKSYQLTLIDHYENTTTDLEEDSIYEFSIIGGIDASADKRFELIFSLEKVTSVEEAVESEFNIYPNPLTRFEHLTLSFSNLAEGNTTISIVDVLGNKIFEKNYFILNDIYTIETPANLLPGIYTVVVKNMKMEKRSKFIVE